MSSQPSGGAGVNTPTYRQLWKGRAAANSRIIGLHIDTLHFSRSFCTKLTARPNAVLHSSSCKRVFKVSFISLDFIIFYYCGRAHTCGTDSIHVEDNFVELVLSFHLYTGSGDPTQDVRLDW